MTAPYEAAHFKLYKAMLPLDHTTFFLYKTQCLRMVFNGTATIVPRSRWRSSRQDREGVGDYEQKERKHKAVTSLVGQRHQEEHSSDAASL